VVASQPVDNLTVGRAALDAGAWHEARRAFERLLGREETPEALEGLGRHLRRLFAKTTTIIHTTRSFAFRYRSAEHFVDVFRTNYGPTFKAFAALEASGQAALEADMLALLRTHDRGDTSGLVVPAEYLETVIVR
jgi:hypothetical protein